MGKRCVYCKSEVNGEMAIDICDRCGVGIWGPKMFKNIQSQAKQAEQTGNLNQGSISDGRY